MYKVKNGLMPTYTTEIFNTAPIRYNLRNADFNIRCFRTVDIFYDTLDPIFGIN